MLSRAPESPIIPNILGIIQRRGNMEGTSIESDLMRSLGLAPAPEEVVPEEELELSFLTALELELELCCCIADEDEDSNIFISCSALRQKFCDSVIICCRNLSKSSHELRKKSSLKNESRRVIGTRLSFMLLLPEDILICIEVWICYRF